MRKPILAGNWKMCLLSQEIATLIEDLRKGTEGVEGREILVCPAFPYLAQVARAVESTPIQIGGQDCSWELTGAFTGEVSPKMLKDVGCTHVILGHSERRHILGEKDSIINKKLLCAISVGLNPVLCVGETLDERQAGKTWTVVEAQLEGGLAGVTMDQCAGLVIAYEPVWAIGTGQTASPDQAQEVHGQIRSWVAKKFGPEFSGNIRILYGGSVNPKNVDALMAQPDVDGGLVGGASLKAADFSRIVHFETG